MQGSKSAKEGLAGVKITAVCATFAISVMGVQNAYLAYSEGNPLRLIVSVLSFLTAGFAYGKINAEDQELVGTNHSYIENYNDHDL